MREQFEHGLIGAPDVGRIARQRDPAEGSLAFREERPDEGRHETREIERVGNAGGLRLRAQVVAVVERDGAALLQRQHRPNVVGHGGHRPRRVAGRVGASEVGRLVDRQAGRDVAVQGVVGRGLIGHGVELLAATDELGLDLGGVADRARSTRLGRPRRPPRAQASASSNESVRRST